MSHNFSLGSPRSLQPLTGTDFIGGQTTSPNGSATQRDIEAILSKGDQRWVINAIGSTAVKTAWRTKQTLELLLPRTFPLSAWMRRHNSHRALNPTASFSI
jgi:hypothetical protein